MERMQKQSGESENTRCPARLTAASESHVGKMAQRIGSSPAMAAQRRKLEYLFGGAIQCVKEHGLLQEKFSTMQMKHELGEEEFLPGRFGVAQRKINGGTKDQGQWGQTPLTFSKKHMA